jgi:2-polyprenyl-6-methoxyphenol hydroxylase-like FAD-dependent oxidoreductase
MNDVLIVGGGPAGLAAAVALSAKGAVVTVADPLIPPIDRGCGEGMMPEALAALGRLGIQLDTTQGFAFCGIRFADENYRQVATADFPSGIGYGFRHTALHMQMVRAAEAAGVNLRWGQPVGIETNHDALIGDDTVRFDWLIGADGQSSQVRRWAALEQAKIFSTRYGLRRHYRIPPWSEYGEVHWGSLGEACITPVSENEICVVTLSSNTHDTADEVLAGLPWLQEKLDGAAISSQERGSETRNMRLTSVARGNVALLGEASGTSDEVAGAGLAQAFREAELLVRSLEVGNLEMYERGHAAILQQPQQVARILVAMDRWHGLRNRALWVLSEQPALFERLLGVYIGEESLAHFLLWKGVTLGRQLLQAPGL